MPLKYHCLKCGRRFVEWGAEKLGFKCPDCEDEELVHVGTSDDTSSRRPTLKRALRRAAAVKTASEKVAEPPKVESVKETEGEEAEEVVAVSGDEEDMEEVAEGPGPIVDETEAEISHIDPPATTAHEFETL